MAAKLPPNPVVFFPKNVKDKAYENKLMYITVYKSKSPAQIAEIIKEGMQRTTKQIVDGVSAAVKGDISQLLRIQDQVKEFKGEPKMSVVLPMPTQFQDAQDHSYNTDTGFIKDMVDNTGVGGTIDKTIGKIAANTNSQKILANPGFFQNYTGSAPRQFNFTFYLIPNNADEAEDVKKIILLLKKYSSPSLHNNAIMIAPHFFLFQFSNETLQKLTGIRPCVVTNVSTNYAHSGVLETTFDGMPKGIELTIAISELRTITAEQWE